LRIQAREKAMAPKIGSPEVGLLEAGAVEVRLLCGADAAAFRALRLEALAGHPSAFASTRHEEADQRLAEVALRLDQGAVFGAFAGGALAGSAGLAVPARAKKRHKGVLWGVYVRDAARGQGLGRRLVEGVIAHAHGRVEQLHATVTTGNHAARQLYRSLGFQTYGLEPRGLKVGASYFDQELLVLLLRR
jgi:ribosomal protein S18 acetylase RimI-like enzyme